jgi:hypothetical protein
MKHQVTEIGGAGTVFELQDEERMETETSLDAQPDPRVVRALDTMQRRCRGP